ncbi:hypothetical protein [Streptomyces sp. A0592]|uniref:hypothetical protein n=1 Tax=Streptomyces sp. A0592 TaxID=2563099 RepID=UPI00109E62EC|nr:hypothetical protein [Streptomyces sp. A0592]THA84876.1 hypothetical protein E6U81_10740 [Streptomyces sp. A0592]
MIGLYILGAMLLFGAFKLLRGAYYLRKAKRLEAEIAVIEGRTAATNAETDAVKAERKAQQAAAVVALGFVPEAELDTENARPVPPEQTAAVAAVKAGDWEAAAAYLDAAGQDWEERWQRMRPLSELAAEDDAWLLAWRAARPSDPSAALVNADTGVLVAWNVRGSARASHTTQEQFRIFRELLLKAQEQAREAQRLADPADPVPFMVEQSISQGLGYSHEDYRELWSQITKRDPKNLSAHTSAMQYWSQKWRGSHELALAFARECAAGAEPGELLSVLPLIAYIEQELHESDLKPETFFKEPEVLAAVDSALADLAAADPQDWRSIRLRHLLAWFLFWQDRDAEAVEQFRHIDGYIGAMPWYYWSPSRYVYARDWAVREVTPGL